MAETTLFGMKINLPGGKKKLPPPPTEISPDALKSFTPGIPAVNMLPPEVKERYRVEGIRNKFAVAGASLLVLVGAGFGFTLASQQSLAAEISAVESNNQALTTQLRELSVYQNYVSDVESKRATLVGQFANDVQYPQIVDWIKSAAEANGVEVRDFSFGSADTGGNDVNCASPDPFNPSPAVGCISLTAFAPDVDSVVKFTQALDSEEAFVYPYFPSVTIGDDGVEMVGSVGFTALAGATRYADMMLPVLDQIDPTGGQSQEPADATTDETVEGE